MKPLPFDCLLQETHQSTSIALKKCRLVHEMKKKHKERWSMEIEIMLRLQHENVIQALHVPEPLKVLQESHDLPMLAMEYCSEGDLRSVSWYMTLFCVNDCIIWNELILKALKFRMRNFNCICNFINVHSQPFEKVIKRFFFCIGSE